jgi:hypothetical protein
MAIITRTGKFRTNTQGEKEPEDEDPVKLPAGEGEPINAQGHCFIDTRRDSGGLNSFGRHPLSLNRAGNAGDKIFL